MVGPAQDCENKRTDCESIVSFSLSWNSTSIHTLGQIQHCHGNWLPWYERGGWECVQSVCAAVIGIATVLHPPPTHAHSFTASNFQKTSLPQSHSPQLFMGPATFMQPCRVNHWASASYHTSFSAAWLVLWDRTWESMLLHHHAKIFPSIVHKLIKAWTPHALWLWHCANECYNITSWHKSEPSEELCPGLHRASSLLAECTSYQSSRFVSW